jgi:hypothetical protein
MGVVARVTVIPVLAHIAVSRARDQAHLYTDDRARLTAAIGLRDGSQVAALDHDMGWDAGMDMV